MTLSDYFGLLLTFSLSASLFYALRRRLIKKSLTHKIGSAATWRNAHIYLGIAFALTFLLHTKFVLPTGAFSWWLYILSWWTIITGILGWYLQRWIPRKLTSLTKTEMIYERIPELCEHLRETAATVAETSPAILTELHNRQITNYLSKPFLCYTFNFDSGKIILTDLDIVKLRLSEDQYEEVEQMAVCVRNKSDLDIHFTLQAILRLWIYLHAPTSFLLLVLVAFHIFSVIYY